MTCIFCKDSMEQSLTAHFAQLEDGCIVIKNVPCDKCAQCGKVVYSAFVTQRLDEIIDYFAKAHAEIAVVNYSAT